MGLKDQMSGIIPDDKLPFLSDRFDVIGDIAILALPADLAVYGRSVAKAIIAKRNSIKTVLNKTSPVTGTSRTVMYEILAGTSTVTDHREYGYTYRLDVTQVFFNPRLSTERMRVAGQVTEGEKVFVPFCGVGPFAVPAAARGAGIVAVEQNAEACHWLRVNCQLNNVTQAVRIIQGDAFATTASSLAAFDRAIIPTPYGMDSILERITPFVRPSGCIHFYTFKKKCQIAGLIDAFRDRGFNVLYAAACGNIAPGVNRWVFDLQRTA